MLKLNMYNTFYRPTNIIKSNIFCISELFLIIAPRISQITTLQNNLHYFIKIIYLLLHPSVIYCFLYYFEKSV